MIDDRALRAADPVAGWRVDPESVQAQAVLTAILDSPRESSTLDTRRPPMIQRVAGTGGTRRVLLRRAALGAATLGVAVTVGVVGSTLWDSGPGARAAAYAVTPRADGSVQLTVRWAQLDDPDGLAAALRKAGVPTVVATRAPTHYCSTTAERERADAALNKPSPSGGPLFSKEGYLMRPKLFPADSTVVITSYDDSAKQLHYTAMYLAPRDTTSCAISSELGAAWYIGPAPFPTGLMIPAPQPTS
jgi:hypothetical protein